MYSFYFRNVSLTFTFPYIINQTSFQLHAVGKTDIQQLNMISDILTVRIDYITITCILNPKKALHPIRYMFCTQIFCWILPAEVYQSPPFSSCAELYELKNLNLRVPQPLQKIATAVRSFSKEGNPPSMECQLDTTCFHVASICQA